MINRKNSIFCMIVVLILIGFTKQIDSRDGLIAPESSKLLRIPKALGEWSSEESLGLGLREQQILQLDSYVRRSYKNAEGKRIQVYIGYWKTQSGDYQAAKHSPKTCLPSNGWEVLKTSERRVDALSAEVSSILARFKSNYMLFDYWFFSGEEIYNHEWLALFKIASQKLLHSRSDGGIVELGIALEDGEEESITEAQEILEQFVSDFRESFATQ